MKQDSCIIQSGCSVFSFFNGVLMLYDLQGKVIYILNLDGTSYFYGTQRQHTTDNVFQMCCKLCLFVAEKLKLDTIVAFSCCKFSHQFDYSHDTTANVRTILDLLNRMIKKKETFKSAAPILLPQCCYFCLLSSLQCDVPS